MSSLLRSIRSGRRHDRRGRADAPSVFDPSKEEEGRAPFMLQLGDKYSLVYDDGEWTAGESALLFSWGLENGGSGSVWKGEVEGAAGGEKREGGREPKETE